MPPRFHVAAALAAGQRLTLPEAASRHVQVLRLQPGDAVIAFDGASDVEWSAVVARIGRHAVELTIGASMPAARELLRPVTLALGMPANERMDALIEKATELGAAAVAPLVCARSVLRLAGDRAAARRERWHKVAVAASEQCGRTRVPRIDEPQTLVRWLAAASAQGAPDRARWLLSLDAEAAPIGDAIGRLAGADAGVVVLSGPEGGLSDDEERAALAHGFVRIGLGPRVLRADTAPLAALAAIAAHAAHAASARATTASAAP